MSLTHRLSALRATEPERIAEVLASRPAADEQVRTSRLLILACDHPARGALGSGIAPMAMASREDLLERCLEALSRPGVNGFLGTPDLVEDLALLGALDGKLVLGSMNRGGLQGAAFEMDDRFTAYDAEGIAASRLDGGKMLLRIDLDDPSSVRTLESCARAVTALHERGLMALVEPFLSTRVEGRVVNVLSPDAVVTSVAIASALGRSSAHSWLKVPVVDDFERVAEASSLPMLLLGGPARVDRDQVLGQWARALQQPNVRGLVVGRSLLYPSSGDVATAVDEAVALL